MLARYQNGCLQKTTRKDGAERWQFRWLEKGADGTSRERKKTIGLVKDYPEHGKKLQDLLAGLRLNINTDGPTELTSVTMGAAVEHYMQHELADNGADVEAARAARQHGNEAGQKRAAGDAARAGAAHRPAGAPGEALDRGRRPR